MVKKLVIGIVPTVKKDEVNPYEYKYTYLNSYSKMITNLGAIPFGLLLNDEKINDDALNICDGFIFPGGKSLEKVHFTIILHALKYNKPILGICLGMQVLNYFSILKDNLNDRNMKLNEDNLWNVFEEIKNEEYFKLSDIDIPNNHGYKIMKDLVKCNNDTLSESRHNININKDSFLYHIYNKDKISVLSLHIKQISSVGSDFFISAKADDNVIEAIEYKDKAYFIIGVQYHPELDDKLLFKHFLFEVEKRRV